MRVEMSDQPDPKDVVHLVPNRQLDAEPVVTLCGKRLWTDGPGGSIRPSGHDFVFTPDPRHLTTCGPCLDEAAFDHVQRRRALAELP